MPTYRYRAKKGPKDVIEATLEASGEKEAIEKIHRLGYIPVHIEEYVRRSLPSPVLAAPGSAIRIKSREITIFSRELASLLKSGVPILSAINIILEQANPYFKAVLMNIHNMVKDGASFSSGLAKYPRLFSPLYIAMVRTGEDSGALSQALLRIADYRRKQEEALSRLRMALAYPILMAVVGVSTIVFMLTFVIPRLTDIFINLGQQLPLPTRILISLSRALSHWWLWAGLAVVLLLVGRQLKAESSKVALSRLKLHFPVLGNVILKVELSRFSRTLELLLKSGITILKAIDIAVPVIDNEIIKQQLKVSYKELEQGGSFGRSLKNSKLFPLFMTNLIIVGEESGRLNEALSEVADTYERDADEAIKIMTNLLEPLMILVMGLIVGFIVVAMLLPVFEINIMAR